MSVGRSNECGTGCRGLFIEMGPIQLSLSQRDWAVLHLEKLLHPQPLFLVDFQIKVYNILIIPFSLDHAS